MTHSYCKLARFSTAVALLGCAASPAAPNRVPEGPSSSAAVQSVEALPATSSSSGPSAPVTAPSAAPAAAPEDDRTAYERARPVFDRYCAKCHTSASGKAGALRHFNMDSYPFGGHHASEVAGAVREVLGATGKRATMPKDAPGTVQGSELQAILDWASAFDRAHPPSAAKHDHEHDHEHHE